MKHIDMNQLEIPKNWQLRADRAIKVAAEKADSKAKLSYIQNRSDLWRILAPELLRLSNNKCWYCGKRISPNSDVDHFRPKGKPDECSHHEGYWWLAFNWTNYRMSCKECNTGGKDENNDEHGKGNHFPLLNTDCNHCLIENCVRPFNNEQRFDREEPVLLDPTNSHDPDLIYYQPTGMIGCKSIEATDIKRVDISREIFFWDSSNAEREKIYRTMKRFISVIVILYNFRENPDILPAITEAKEAIVDAIADDAPYDVAAKQFLLDFRAIYPCLNEIF